MLKSKQFLSGRPQRVLELLFIWILAATIPAAAQNQNKKGATPEQKTARYFDAIRTRPLELHAFLRGMPKGGDLHSHLMGAVYAETYIQWAAETKPDLCVDMKTMAPSSSQDAPCGDEKSDRPPASLALKDNALYRRLVDAWSIRNWQYSGQSGRDRFFDAFGKFDLATEGRFGEMIAEVASRAALGRVSYLELLLGPDNRKSRDIGRQLKWSEDLGKMREELLAKGIAAAVEEARRTFDQAEARKRELLKCDTPQADAGCRVTIRYIFQVGRNNPPEQAFAQMVAAMETANVDPRLVALNLVQAEDTRTAMSHFSLQMRMLDYLRAIYPKAHITLHAGELAPGLVPPEGLRFHIRESVRKGHAERIGHGVAVMYEDDPFALLREMAQRNVMVEICLSSNDVILGARGKRHPLALYLKYGVPVALATDDEGILRTDITREYLKAAQEHGLRYTQLKAMARTSLEHAFIAGASFWKDAKRFVPVPRCATAGSDKGGLSSGCRQFLESSEKARLQWDLERAFAEFEGRY